VSIQQIKKLYGGFVLGSQGKEMRMGRKGIGRERKRGKGKGPPQNSCPRASWNEVTVLPVEVLYAKAGCHDKLIPAEPRGSLSLTFGGYFCVRRSCKRPTRM
jgi:hypothetical protein